MLLRSGRKFKRCCGSVTGTVADITDADRAVAYGLLERMALSHKFADDFEAVAALLHDDDSDDSGPLDFADDEVAMGRVLDWFCFDVPLQSGGTVADRTLRDHAADLTPGARRLIGELRDTPMRLLQVRTVLLGRMVICADVVDPSGTFQIFAPELALERDDLLIARIVNRGSISEIEGDPGVLPPEGARRFARDLRRIRRKAARLLTPAAIVRMIEGACLLRLIAAFESLLDAPVYTTEGDPANPTSAYFIVHDRAAVLEAITASDQAVIESDGAPSTTAFRLMATDTNGNYVLGMGVLDGETLRVDTFSPARAERARACMIGLAGPYLTFDRIEAAVGPVQSTDGD